MLGFAVVGASSGPPGTTTRTCAPDADNSAARTEPAAPAPTTMKSYCSLITLVIANSQILKSDFNCSLEGPKHYRELTAVARPPSFTAGGFSVTTCSA